DFWLNPQGDDLDGPFAGRTALVVDAEDRFTTMLAHQLRHLGLAVTISPWSEVQDADLDAADIVVAGPGPGDPRDAANSRIARMREVVAQRMDAEARAIAVAPVGNAAEHGTFFAPRAYELKSLDQLQREVF
ncbi:glutamine amidotransferase-related protein, partial [Burkholderia sp. SIMBA_024]|uniref:glutamine amidotransferase-related protein n=1 Tax=Burkholderia sp. SIMBA_024 TaxID=3085768 RepID=UPI003979CF51